MYDILKYSRGEHVKRQSSTYDMRMRWLFSWYEYDASLTWRGSGEAHTAPENWHYVEIDAVVSFRARLYFGIMICMRMTITFYAWRSIIRVLIAA